MMNRTITAVVCLFVQVSFDSARADGNLGLRFPLGLDYLFTGSVFDVFVELVPIMDLVPDSDFELGVAVGARLFF